MPVPAPPPLRATIIIDYQNIHLVGHDTFARPTPRHKTLIDPIKFAEQLIKTRNDAQKPVRNRGIAKQSLNVFLSTAGSLPANTILPTAPGTLRSGTTGSGIPG